MDFSDMKFPIIKNVYAKLLSDDLIGVRPGESYKESLSRHIRENVLKERKTKIEKIKNRIKKNKPI